jgi:hypothetical protein
MAKKQPKPYDARADYERDASAQYRAPAAAATAAAPAAPAAAPAVEQAADVAAVTGEAFGGFEPGDETPTQHGEEVAAELERLLEGGDDKALAAVIDEVIADDGLEDPATSVTRELIDGGGGRAGEVQFTIPVDPALGALSLASLPVMAADVRLHLQAYLGCLFTLDEGRCVTADGRIFTLAMNAAGDALEARLP